LKPRHPCGRCLRHLAYEGQAHVCVALPGTPWRPSRELPRLRCRGLPRLAPKVVP